MTMIPTSTLLNRWRSILLVLAASLLVAAAPRTVILRGSVVGITDGDTCTLLVGATQYKIRLEGIDAPEMDQPFGKQSKRFVSKLIFGKTVDVKDLGLDNYKRTLGYITEGSTEVNEAIVTAGLARHYVQVL
jgi:endonuclease YncB( thermonuclease family)